MGKLVFLNYGCILAELTRFRSSFLDSLGLSFVWQTSYHLQTMIFAISSLLFLPLCYFLVAGSASSIRDMEGAILAYSLLNIPFCL